jgi:hypothetical protein
MNKHIGLLVGGLLYGISAFAGFEPGQRPTLNAPQIRQLLESKSKFFTDHGMIFQVTGARFGDPTSRMLATDNYLALLGPTGELTAYPVTGHADAWHFYYHVPTHFNPDGEVISEAMEGGINFYVQQVGAAATAPAVETKDGEEKK